MRRAFGTGLTLFLLAAAAYAVDPGRAQGTVTVDGDRIDLNYAYAIDHQKNEVTNRRDDTRIVLTDKPLPDKAKLEDIDYSFPDGTLGVVVCVSHDDKVSHIVLQHAKGMYDGGYFDGDPNYSFKRTKTDRGTIAGSLGAHKVKTNTMTFSFDVDFDANVK
jgi:hypothetical protein